MQPLWLVVAVALVVAVLVLASYRKVVALVSARRGAEGFLRSSLDQCSGEERRRRVADLNEMTIDIQRDLDQPGLVPGHCARASFATGALVSLIEVAARLGGESSQPSGPAQWWPAVASLLLGVVGAIGCASLGRVAERRASELRRDWDALIRRSTTDVPT